MTIDIHTPVRVVAFGPARSPGLQLAFVHGFRRVGMKRLKKYLLAACRTFDVSPLFSTIALFSLKL